MIKHLILGIISIMLSANVQAETGKWEQLDNIPDCLVWNAAPESGDTATWIGVCRDGYAEGEGELVWRVPKEGAPETHIYTGSMRRGMLDGKGIYTWPTGFRYEGMWKEDYWHGIGTTYDVFGNKLYEGIWVQSVKSGYGVETIYCPPGMPDDFLTRILQGLVCGMTYKGNWQKGLPNGEGTMTTSYFGSFSGNWTNGCLTKYFVMTLTFGVKKETCKYE